MNLATAYVELRADVDQLKRDLDKVEGDTKKKADSLGRTFARVFSAAAFGLAIKKSIDAASDLNETVSKTRVIFGAAADEIEQMGDKAARSMGLSKRAYLDAASGLKGLLENLGLASKESTQWSMDLTQLGSDLASFFNTDPAEAVQAIGAALRGEQEPIRRYNVNINEAAIKTKAFELGLYSGKGAIEQSAKAQATLALILEQTSAAQGDFARTADGAANSQRIAAAAAEDSAASLGQSFLPIYTRVVQVVTALAEGFGALPAPVQVALVAMVGLVAISGPLGTLKDMVVKLTTAYKGLNATTKATATGVGVFAAVTLVAFTLRSNQAAEGAKNIANAIAKISSGTDEQALNAYNVALADMVVHGQNANRMFAHLAETNLEGLKRILDLKQAQGASREELSALTVAIYDEEQARKQAAKTQEQYGANASDVTSEIETQTGAIDDQTESVDDLTTAFAELLGTLDVNDAYRNALDSIDELGEAWTEAWAKGQTPEEAEKSMRAYSQQLDDAKRDVITFGDTLDGVANKERIAEILTMLDEGKLEEAQTAIDALTRERDLRINVRLSGNAGLIEIAGVGNVKQYAEGGIVDVPTYMAGEAGREAVLPLTRPSRLAEILADERVAGPVAAAMGGTGGNNGFHVHGDVIVGSRQDYAELGHTIDRSMWRVAA